MDTKYGGIKTEESDMVNLGFLHQQIKKISFGAELYYKYLRNVSNYVEGKNLFLNNADWEENVQSGKGGVMVLN
jgi:hypothetical protein